MMVRKADLGPLDEIASGAFGCVYRARGFTLPGDPTPVAYKEFTTDRAVQARAARATVDFWESLGVKDRAELGAVAAWPRALVDEGGTVSGLLMPLIPDEFFIGAGHKPRDLQWLISTQLQRAAAGEDDIDLIDRHMILAKLAYAYGWLHKRGWVYGDLNFRNAVFALNPPRVRLLDCDGAARLSDRARDQNHTEFWIPPEHIGTDRLQDEESDVYKLGLVILRGLTPGTGGASSNDPGRLAGELGPAGRDLMARVLASDPNERPTAKDIFIYLRDLLEPRITPPVVSRAKVSTPFRLRGQDACVECDVEGADEIVIHSGNGDTWSADPQAAGAGVWFRPEVSGPVAVEARNRFGSVFEDAGEVELYELPTFDIGRVRLPQPRVPGIKAVVLQSVAAAVGERPMASVGMPVAAPPMPDLAEVLGAVQPVARPLPPFPRFDDAVSRAAHAVRAPVLDSGVDLASALNDAIADAFPDLATQRQGA